MSEGNGRFDGYVRSLLSGVRFGKFVSVGVIGAISDNAVLAVLGLGFAVPEMWAKAAGIETAILVMFAVNEHWTFATEGSSDVRAVLGRLGRSHLVRSGGVAVQLSVYWVLTQHLAVTLYVFGTDLWFLAASPIAIAFAMVVNYVFESLFTWQVHLEGESSEHGNN
ncbi:GtrA family protein [Halorhabdus rudnickae]|uniref:GtrA family protein n=1 Tax=Halorhabdus rudnickae TaxID=1775544 RepID=UPI0010841F66|nr:GtrA family protein [Halorhabdus rudnickae]